MAAEAVAGGAGTGGLGAQAASARGGSGAEFQAVVLAGGFMREMFPLCEDTPAALLPVANRPLLCYQLDLLEKAGFSEVIVLCEEPASEPIRSYVEGRRGKIRVDLVALAEDLGTAAMLREVKDRITRDFVVISGDLVTEGSIHHLADVHRIRDATCTMLLKEVPTGEVDSRGRVKKHTVEDFVGLSPDSGRVVFLESAEDVGKDLVLPKGLLKRCPALEMHTDVLDAHCYVFSKWVLGLLDERPKISSVKFELVPYLVRRQFLGLSGVPESLREGASHALALANSMSAGADVAEPDDLIRCFGLVLPADGLYCARAKSVAAYGRVNRDVATWARCEYTPWPKLPEAPGRYRDSVIGSDTNIGAKVTIANSCVGRHCEIGAGVKINSCIIMDHVKIESGCIIQNSIICRDSTIGANCNFKNCQVGSTCEVAANSMLKDEQVSKEGTGEEDYW